MHKKRHLGLAILIFFLVLFASTGMYFGSLVIGVMATDSCSGSINDTPLIIWLLGVTPILLLIATFVPPILFYKGRSYWTVAFSLLTPGIALVVCGIVYLAIVALLCG